MTNIKENDIFFIYKKNILYFFIFLLFLYIIIKNFIININIYK